jgi:sugar/nucleoside kinase (ribokinase family)
MNSDDRIQDSLDERHRGMMKRHGGVPMFSFEESVPLPDRENDVLAVGELLVDMLAADYGDENASNAYHRYFGGSPANIAMNVRRLGIRSELAAAVGQDGLGSFLLEHLRKSGMNAGLVQEVDHATSMVVVTRSKGTPVPIFYREADHFLTFAAALEKVLKQSKILHFSCWPISRQPARAAIEMAMEKAREYGLLIGFDPNYHPMIWEKGEDGVSYVKSILCKVDIVKPSEDDAQRLFGKDTHENQMAKFLELGARFVVMTLGKEGAIVSNGSETLRFDTLATEIVDATGAGDAFWSGFYSALVKGRKLKDALQLGFAVSAYKLQYAGAVVDLPSLDDIQGMYGL